MVVALYGTRVLAIPKLVSGGPGSLIDLRSYDFSTGLEVGTPLLGFGVAGLSCTMIVPGPTRALVVTTRPLLVDL
jgi:hypothetical protein